jgi:hypothetical protein
MIHKTHGVQIRKATFLGIFSFFPFPSLGRWVFDDERRKSSFCSQQGNKAIGRTHMTNYSFLFSKLHFKKMIIAERFTKLKIIYFLKTV